VNNLTDFNPQLHCLQIIENQPDCVDQKYHVARFEKGTRYYTVILDKDLFDDWVIIIANGRIGTKLGRIRTIAFSCFVDACGKFQATIKNRAKRGYLLESYRHTT
jgi:predicted DNA-binding WGR domain protein